MKDIDSPIKNRIGLPDVYFLMRFIMCNFTMLRHIFIIIVLALPIVSKAQTIVDVLGGSISAATYTVSYCVGQVAVNSDNNHVYRLFEGVLPSLLTEEMPISETRGRIGMSIDPTTSIVLLERDMPDKDISVCVYSIDGYLLKKMTWNGPTLRYDISSIKAGVYLLQVENKTFKVTKR